MIHIAINHIAERLNRYLKRRFDLTDDIVVTSDLVQLDGTVAPDNKLVFSLINVEIDRAPQQSRRAATITGDRGVHLSQPIYLNLYVIVAGHFAANNYAESLKFVSRTIEYFHRHPIFDHTSTSDLDSRIERLTLEIENLDIQQLSSLWSIVGGKYLPSIVYKIRLIGIDTDEAGRDTPTILGPVGRKSRAGGR